MTATLILSQRQKRFSASTSCFAFTAPAFVAPPGMTPFPGVQPPGMQPYQPTPPPGAQYPQQPGYPGLSIVYHSNIVAILVR